MSDPDVTAVVEKAFVSGAGDHKSTDSADAPSAPTARTESAEDRPSADAPSKEDSSSSDTEGDRTAFEHDLISELEADEQKEFEGLSPAEQRSRLDWMKRRTRRDARQRTEEGRRRKAFEVLRQAGVTQEDLLTLVRTKAHPGDSSSKAAEAVKRGFARLREKAADAETREDLRESEQVILETVEDAIARALTERVRPLEERLQQEDQRRQASRRQTLDREIDDLEEKEGFTASLIETYRDQIRDLGVRYPDWSAWKLLHYLASEEELKRNRRAAKREDNGKPSAARPTPIVKKEPATERSSSAAPEGPARRISLDRVIASVLRRK